MHSDRGQDDADDGAFEPDDDHVLYGQGDLGGQDHGDGGGEHDDLRDADDGDEEPGLKVAADAEDGGQEHLGQAHANTLGRTGRVRHAHQLGEGIEDIAEPLKHRGSRSQDKGGQANAHQQRDKFQQQIHAADKTALHVGQQVSGGFHGGDRFVDGPGEHAALAGLLNAALLLGVVIGLRLFAQRIDAAGDGGTQEGDQQGDEEIQHPIVGDVQGAGHDDHKGDGHGGEAGGDDAGLLGVIFVVYIHLVGEQKAHGGAAHKGGDGIHRGPAGGLPQHPGEGADEYADEVHKAIVNQQAEQGRADDDHQSGGLDQAVEQIGAVVRIEDDLGPEVKADHDCGHQAENFEAGEDDVGDAAVPGLLDKGPGHPQDHQQQGQIIGRGAQAADDRVGQNINRDTVAVAHGDLGEKHEHADEAEQDELDDAGGTIFIHSLHSL